MGTWARTGSHPVKPLSQRGDRHWRARVTICVAELMASLGPTCGPGGQQEAAHGWGPGRCSPPLPLGQPTTAWGREGLFSLRRDCPDSAGAQHRALRVVRTQPLGSLTLGLREPVPGKDTWALLSRQSDEGARPLARGQIAAPALSPPTPGEPPLPGHPAASGPGCEHGLSRGCSLQP